VGRICEVISMTNLQKKLFPLSATDGIQCFKWHVGLYATYTTKLGWDTSDHRVRHFGPYDGTVRTTGPWTVRYLGSKCLLDTSVLAPKCLTLRTHLNSAEVSQYRSVPGPKCPIISSPYHIQEQHVQHQWNKPGIVNSLFTVVPKESF